MSKLKVKAGDEVQQGALLGLAGMTGQVTGPHVHWQCMVHSQKVNCDDLTKIMK
jgi:murein DD-endopeptidase MepM/ murein hydrolase activator NlpD